MPINDDEEDPAHLWAEIHRLRAALQGPDGYTTWKDAAIAERLRRIKAEQPPVNDTAKGVPDHEPQSLR
jgi:hypothetical protein